MTIKSGTTLVTFDDDQDTNTSPNPSFDSVLRARLSRRSLLKGTMGLAAGTFFGGSLIACGDDESPAAAPLKTLKLDFTAVGKSLADTVVVPPGYTASVLFRLGDPIAAGVAEYLNTGADSAASYAQRAGDHADGIAYFGLGGEGTDVLCPLWCRGQWPRTVGHGHRHRPQRHHVLALERREVGCLRGWQRRFPQCREHVRLGRRDRPIRGHLHAQEAHCAGPFRA